MEKQDLDSKMEKVNDVEFQSYVDALKASSVATHYWHLITKSYAEHIALGSYYEKLDGLVDKLVECYQGKMMMRVSQPDALYLDSHSDRDAHFNYLCKISQEMMNKFDIMPDVQDIIIDIKNLLNKTKYLLTLS